MTAIAKGRNSDKDDCLQTRRTLGIQAQGSRLKAQDLTLFWQSAKQKHVAFFLAC